MDLLNRIAGIVAAAVLISSASVASAYSIHIEARNPGGLDTITVDVFLDAPTPGLTTLSVGVLSDSSGLLYDPIASAAADIIHPGNATSGAQVSYMLYAYRDFCGVRCGTLISIMYPWATPAFATWPSPPVGKQQVNIDYREPGLRVGEATGMNLWIATLVYQIVPNGGGGAIELTLSGGDNGLYSGTQDISDQVTLTGGPINVLPEPTTALLIGFGLLGARAASRKL